MLLTPSRDTQQGLTTRLTGVAARAQVAVRAAFTNPHTWEATWPAVGPAVIGRVFTDIRDETVPAVNGLLADTVDQHTGFRPPPNQVGPPAATYRPLGVGDLAAVALSTRDRVAERVAAGTDLVDAVGIEGRAWEGRAVAEPFRLWRHVAADVTTAPTDPLWRGWVRVPEAGACSFCRMLATRGAVYTKATAGGPEFRYHAHCRCSAAPVMDPVAAAALSEHGAAEWARMQADGDVPKLAGTGRTSPQASAGPRPSPGNSGAGTPPTPPPAATTSGASEPPRKPRLTGPLPDKPGVTGSVDRTRTRRIRQAELQHADRIAARGHDVTFIPPQHTGRTHDCLIDGQPWELKGPTTWRPDGLVRAIRNSKGQSDSIHIDMSGSSMTRTDAEAAMRDAVRRYGMRLRRIVIIEVDASGLDIVWER